MPQITSTAIGESLQALLTETFDGMQGSTGSWFTESKPGQGVFGTVESLTAAEASKQSVPGHASIAAQVEHMRYSLSLANRWAKGEEPYSSADWGAAWRKTTVTDGEWKKLLADVRKEYSDWKAALATELSWSGDDLTAKISSVVHTAYHLGAIRQMILHIK